MTSELSCWEKGDDAKTGRNEHIRSTTRISKVLLLSFIRTPSRQYPTLNFPLLELSKPYAEMKMSGAAQLFNFHMDRKKVRDGDVMVYVGSKSKELAESFSHMYYIEVLSAKELRKLVNREKIIPL
jgi:hypothetical protein